LRLWKFHGFIGGGRGRLREGEGRERGRVGEGERGRKNKLLLAFILISASFDSTQKS
jgi:hypothetical protein